MLVAEVPGPGQRTCKVRKCTLICASVVGADAVPWRPTTFLEKGGGPVRVGWSTFRGPALTRRHRADGNGPARWALVAAIQNQPVHWVPPPMFPQARINEPASFRASVNFGLHQRLGACQKNSLFHTISNCCQ